MKFIKRKAAEYFRKINVWTKSHIFGLFFLNVILLLMVLLNTAGYFRPFLYLNINLIVFISLSLSIIFLGATNKAMLLISLVFWLFSCFLKVVKVEAWADRTSIYAFQSLLLGIFILFIEDRK
jgi:hypothetical protein